MPPRAPLATAASNLAIRFYEAIRSKHATERLATTEAADFGQLAGAKYATVVTFRANGEPVPTPVWFGLADSNLYFRTVVPAGKLRRIATRPDVLVAPCTANGRPTGPATPGHAEVISDAEASAAEAAVQANYGVARHLYMRLIATKVPAAYVKITPQGATPVTEERFGLHRIGDGR